MKLLSALLALAIVGAMTPVFAADWTQPESLDIYDPSILDLLDTDLDAIMNTAWEAYGDGDYEKAAQYYLALLYADLGNEITLYNLAGCYGLLDQPELATEFLERSFAAGYTDIGYAREDPDFATVRDTPVFQEMLERMEQQLKESEAECGNVVYFKEPVYLRGRIYLPEDFDPRESYPLVVGLHGFGSQPDRYVRLWKRFEKVDFIYVVPQAPYPFMSDIDAVGYSWGSWIEGEPLPPRSWQLSREYIGDVIETIRGLYKVDDVYLLGFSQGAGMALSAGIALRNQIKGIIAFGGWLEDEWLTADELAHGSNVRVFLAHGNEDMVVEFSHSEEARDKLLELGYDVTLHEFTGGHTVPEEALKVVSEWMAYEPPEDTAEEE
ncbi:hypothetical protein JW859_09750 [bacterium]|nr:hypothetical protein [bacterium]